MAAAAKFRDNVVAFTALPNSVRLVLVLVFLNSFRSFGLRFVQQLYLTNELASTTSRPRACWALPRPCTSPSV